MRKALKFALAGAVLATAIPQEVLAGPMSATSPDKVGLSAPTDQVWYRRGWGYRGYRPYYGGYYRRGNPGAAVAAGVGLGLLGAGLAASSGYGYGYPYGGYYPSYGYSYPYPYYGGGWGGGYGW